jgi:hypothetical protein
MPGSNRERTMPEYRCDFLDKNGLILFPAEIYAEDLEAAKRHAFGILNEKDAVVRLYIRQASKSGKVICASFPRKSPVPRGNHLNGRSAFLFPEHLAMACDRLVELPHSGLPLPEALSSAGLISQRRSR